MEIDRELYFSPYFAKVINLVLLLNYSSNYVFNLEPNIYKSLCINTHFIPNNSDLVG